jgi:hypothetical protein
MLFDSFLFAPISDCDSSSSSSYIFLRAFVLFVETFIASLFAEFFETLDDSTGFEADYETEFICGYSDSTTDDFCVGVLPTDKLSLSFLTEGTALLD